MAVALEMVKGEEETPSEELGRLWLENRALRAENARQAQELARWAEWAAAVDTIASRSPSRC